LDSVFQVWDTPFLSIPLLYARIRLKMLDVPNQQSPRQSARSNRRAKSKKFNCNVSKLDNLSRLLRYGIAVGKV